MSMEGIVKPKKRKRLIERKEEASTVDLITTFDDDGLEKDNKHAKRRKLRNDDISKRCDGVKAKDDKGSQEKLTEKDELQKERIHAEGKNSKKDNVVERCQDIDKAHGKEGLKDKLMDNDGLEKEEICPKRRKSKNVALRNFDNVVMAHEKEGQEDKAMDGDGLKKKTVRAECRKPNIDDVHKRCCAVKVQEENGTTENICLDGKDLAWSESLSDAQVVYFLLYFFILRV